MISTACSECQSPQLIRNKNCAKEMGSEMRELKRRVASYKTSLKTQKRKILELERRNDQQDEVISQQNARLSEFEERLAEMSRRAAGKKVKMRGVDSTAAACFVDVPNILSVGNLSPVDAGYYEILAKTAEDSSFNETAETETGKTPEDSTETCKTLASTETCKTPASTDTDKTPASTEISVSSSSRKRNRTTEAQECLVE